MLILSSQVSEAVTHVIKPFSETVVYRLIDELGCEAIFKNNIVFNADFSGGSMSSTEMGNAKLKDNKFTCEIVPNFDPKSLKWDNGKFRHVVGHGISIREIENKEPLFMDRYTDTRLMERFMPCVITLNCSMSFKERIHAYKILPMLYSKYTNGEMYTMEDFVYTYRMPNDVINTLFKIYDMQSDHTKNFMEYLRNWSNGDISLEVNRLDQGDVELTVRRNTCRVYAQIELSQEKPEPDKSSKTNDLYKIDFTITFQFDRIDHLYLEFEPVVENNYLPETYVPRVQGAEFKMPDFVHRYFAEHNYDRFNLNVPIVQTVNFPWYDRWITPETSILRRIDYNEFFISIVTLDDIENPEGVTVVNLETDLGPEFSLSEEVINGLKEQGSRSLYFSDRWNIALYANRNLVKPDMLTLENGTILTIPHRDPKRVYRLVLSERKGIINGTLKAARVTLFDIYVRRAGL